MAESRPASPGRCALAPLIVSVKMRVRHTPARMRASVWRSRDWSCVLTRPYPQITLIQSPQIGTAFWDEKALAHHRPDPRPGTNDPSRTEPERRMDWWS